MGKEKRIEEYILRARWLDDVSGVEFLAAGEYNENFTVTNGRGEKYVFRINHGSQLNLENQIEYEFRVLRAVEESGVTPRARNYSLDAEGLGAGALIMEFLPGVPLDYRKDRDRAAYIFSIVHSLPFPGELVFQGNPILDIAEECRGLITRFPDHPMADKKKLLLDYHREIDRLGRDKAALFKKENTCIVNTEVNSHNFLINEEKSYLVDWEKAVVSYRYQDLGHFLVATTTQWKTDYLYSEEEKIDFLSRYHGYTGGIVPFDELHEKTRLLEKTILLRGLSWCFMAYYEYTMTERTIANRDTFEKITYYLDNIEWYLGKGA